MIHTTEYIDLMSEGIEERIEVEREDNLIYLSIYRGDCCQSFTTLFITEAEELRDMLTRALENAEEVRVVKS